MEVNRGEEDSPGRLKGNKLLRICSMYMKSMYKGQLYEMSVFRELEVKVFFSSTSLLVIIVGLFSNHDLLHRVLWNAVNN